MEFGVSETDSRFATCSLFVGLIIGASFWGIASDAIGRRPAFNMTLGICGTFGLAAGGGPNWVGYVSLETEHGRLILTPNAELVPCMPAWVLVLAETCPSMPPSSWNACLLTRATF